MADEFTQWVSGLELQVQHQERKETLVNNVFDVNHRATGGITLGERFETTSEGSFGSFNERHLATPFCCFP